MYSRADTWAEKIWEKGLLDEVEFLLKNYSNSLKLHGLVYKSAVKFLAGEINKKDAIQRIKFDLHAYIRRQQTWFKKNKNIAWFDISKDSLRQNVYNVING